MSQQIDEYSFLVERLLDILAEQYGFREHWEVSIANNIDTGNVSVALTLRQTPGRHRYGDVQIGFWMASYMFTEFVIIRGRLIDAANNMVGNLQYRGRQNNHPPQVKIYCWLRENSLESRDQYMVLEYRPEPAFGSSVHLHMLLADLLGVAFFGSSVSVNQQEVRIGETLFRSPRELSNTVVRLLTQQQVESTPTAPSQHRPHIRRVEL